MNKERLSKIRILWIDDRERVSGYPEEKIPAPYARWFEVCHPGSNDSQAMSYGSAKDFAQVFVPYWLGEKNGSSLFPVEIIATDYNLRKAAGASSAGIAGRPLGPEQRSVKVAASGTESISVGSTGAVNFDGLLVGTFYAAMTHRHPAILVSITNYMGRLPSEIDTVWELVGPLLPAAVDATAAPGGRQRLNLDASNRFWKNIIVSALQPLRDRIQVLYAAGSITVPLQQLIDLANGHPLTEITIASGLGVRMLPVEGLFCDGFESRRVTEWAKGLLESHITVAQMNLAKSVADELWKEYYDNDDVMEAYRKASELYAAGATNGSEYKKYKTRFAPSSKTLPNGTQGMEIKRSIGDIRKGKHKNETLRWAALFMIKRLFHRMLLIKETVGVEHKRLDQTRECLDLWPVLEEDDLLLLLFPVPFAPFPSPWHETDSKRRSNGISSLRLALKTKTGITFDLLIAGRLMTVGERQVLQGLVMSEDEDLGDTPAQRLDVWRGFGPARMFLFGG